LLHFAAFLLPPAATCGKTLDLWHSLPSRMAGTME
jgi:hypothetical protein